MEPVYEVLRQLHKITEQRDGAIFKTEYVSNVWVEDRKGGPIPPAGHVYYHTPADHEGLTIRLKRNNG